MTPADPDRAPRYFFVHIMKTAGTALRQLMSEHFGAAGVYPSKGLDGSDPFELYLSIDHMLERVRARGDEIEVVAGHFPLRTVDLIDGDPICLTLLRDPVERMLSLLRQRREDRIGRELGRPTTDSPFAGRPLEEIYDRYLGHASNEMTKQLTLTPAEMKQSMFSPAQLDHWHLERAMEALAGMGAVGLQEHFEDFCGLLEARFGWRLGRSEIVNPTEPIAASDELRSRIAADNELDVELYEFAERLVGVDGRGPEPAARG